MAKKLYENIDELGGKIQPQAVELEEAVLGAMLLEKEAFNTVIGILSPDSFYKEQNGRIFSAMINLYNRLESVDILTVSNELRRMGELEKVGGSFYVSQLTNRIASSANIEIHARIVLQQAIKREMILTSTKLIKEAYSEHSDVFDLIDLSEKNVTAITSKLFLSKTDTASELYNKLLEEQKQIRENPNTVLGVPSGFRDLDAVFGGWQKSDLLIFAARPGMGKTAFVLCAARNAVVKNKPTAIFSLEMSSMQLFKRLGSQETEIPHENFKKGLDKSDEAIFIKDMAGLKSAPLFIDDTGGLTLFELRNKARELKRKHGIELIIIDYLQMMSGKGNESNREGEISGISRGLKSLAKELDIPIIALSQLSRKVEERPSKIPQLSDLRDSGAIEQDADVVMFLYRPEYYGIEYDGDNNPTKGVAKIIVAKNRHGILTDVDVRWIGHLTKFVNWDETIEQNTNEIYTPKSLPQNDEFLRHS